MASIYMYNIYINKIMLVLYNRLNDKKKNMK